MRTLLEELACDDVTVKLSPYGGVIALVGAARALTGKASESRERSVLGFDFGHTLVKRAVLRYTGGVLTEIGALPPVLTEWADIYPAEEDEAALGRSVLAFVTGVIAQTAGEQPQAEPVALVSIAAYKQNGRLVGNGPYASIHAAAGDRPAADILSEAASRRAGQLFTVEPIHDGTAASLAHAGAPNSAVIMLGTALGVGFLPASEEGLRAVCLQSR